MTAYGVVGQVQTLSYGLCQGEPAADVPRDAGLIPPVP